MVVHHYNDMMDVNTTIVTVVDDYIDLHEVQEMLRSHASDYDNTPCAKKCGTHMSSDSKILLSVSCSNHNIKT